MVFIRIFDIVAQWIALTDVVCAVEVVKLAEMSKFFILFCTIFVTVSITNFHCRISDEIEWNAGTLVVYWIKERNLISIYGV